MLLECDPLKLSHFDVVEFRVFSVNVGQIFTITVISSIFVSFANAMCQNRFKFIIKKFALGCV